MHLLQVILNLPAQFRRKGDHRPAAGLSVIECPLRDGTAEHLLQAHSLGAQLKLVRTVFLGLAPFVLHRIRQPQTFTILQSNSGRGSAELYRVALAGNTQLRRVDGQPPDGQTVPPALPKLLVVDALVHEMAVHRAVILRPLTFNVDQRPLAAAKDKVLQTRKLEIILFLKSHSESPAPVRPKAPM